MVCKYFCMLVELAEVEKIPLKKSQCFHFCFETPFLSETQKMFWIEQHMCFKPKWNLLWHISFTGKMKTFGCCWLSLGQPVNRKKTFIAAVTHGACHGAVCEFALATYLPWPLGGPLDRLITHLVSKEELPCSLLPSPPHKSYFLSYLAPVARVSEGRLGFWKISSPSPFTK